MSPQVLCILVAETKGSQGVICNGNLKILQKMRINAFPSTSTMAFWAK